MLGFVDDVDAKRDPGGLREGLAWERTRLANERTFLAYVRTALAFAAGGSFLQFVHLPGTESGGWAAIGLGLCVLLWGAWRTLRTRRHLLALRPAWVDTERREGL